MQTAGTLNGSRKRFTREQKLQILQEHNTLGIPISQLARNNGISPITIYLWKRIMNQEDESITPERIRELIQQITNLKKENKQLKYKVADLSVSNDIMVEALEVAKKKNYLNQAKLLEQSKKQKNSK